MAVLHSKHQIRSTSKLLQANKFPYDQTLLSILYVQTDAHLKHPFATYGRVPVSVRPRLCATEDPEDRLEFKKSNNLLPSLLSSTASCEWPLVPPYGTKVVFSTPEKAGSLCGEQFWGRAVRASCDSPRAAGRFLIFGDIFSESNFIQADHHPISEGSLAADPSKKIVPTTML